MMHRIVFLLLALLFTMPVLAVPADPTPFEITLSDGSKIMVRQVGDESYSYLITENGVPVVKGADGLYRLAPGQEELHRSRFKTRFAERNNDLMSNMQHTLSRKMANARSGGTLRKATPFDLADKTYKSTQYAMVVLVEFPDLRFTSGHDIFEFHDMLNKTGYSNHNMTGSVHDYFYDNSYGQFDLQFAVYGPIMTDHEYAYYGQNDNNGNDLNAGELVLEISNKIRNTYAFSTKRFDWDNNGDIDQLIIIYAGKGESSAGGDADKENYIWPHKGYLSNWLRRHESDQKTLPEIGENKVDKYLMTCELSGSGALNGIGTLCHEFSHCLGLPDLYDTDYDANGYLGFGMNAWDLMASGSYNGINGIGECPTGLSLLERYFLGWEDPVVFGSAYDVKNMPAFGDNPREGSFMIRQEGDENEFVILENRQQTKWFRYVDTNQDVHGLLVYRCYYDPDIWESKSINTGTSQYVTIIPCGKTFGSKYTNYYYLTRDEYQSQLFPNIDCNALTPSSHIGFNGRWAHTEMPFAWAIKDIVEDENGLISFSYTDYYDPDPWWDKDNIPITGSSNAKLRYWVDAESEAKTIDYTSFWVVDLNEYDEGFHTLYTQLVNKDGFGSDVVTTPFYKKAAYQQMKYTVWFDNDPSTQRAVENEENKGYFLFETDKLAEGFHTIHIQAYNGDFLSEVREGFFYRTPEVSLTGQDLRVQAIIDGVHSDHVRSLLTVVWPK